MDMFGADFHRLESAMIAREKTQGVLASNIANADTPNYHADRRSFSDFLAAQEQGQSVGKPATTNPMHIDDTSRSELSESLSGSHVSRSMDGNNVDAQKEMARMSENQLMHELTIRLLKGKLTGLANTIKEGSR